jgi:hypothetical protein
MAEARELEAKVVDPLLSRPIVMWMLSDIGVSPLESEENIRTYVDAVKQIESSGGRNTTGKANKVTGNRALGDFQWFPAPFSEDVEAASLYFRKAGLPEPEYIQESKEHKDPRKLSPLEQEELFLIRMYRLEKNDNIAKIATGDINAGRDFYFRKHHTNPDKETIQRTNQFLPLPKDIPVPQNLESKPVDSIKLGNLRITDEGVTFKPTTVESVDLGDLRIKDEEAPQKELDKLTDYAATFPNEIDRKKLEDTLQEVRTDVKKVADTYKSVGLLTGAGPVPDRVLEPVIPTKRGQIPIPQRPQLEEVTTPQRTGRFPEVTVDAQRVPTQAVGPVSVPQRDLVSIPPTSTPRLESELAATQMKVLEPDPVEKYLDRVVGSMPRVEAELASTQMAAMQPRVPSEVAVPQRDLKVVPEVDPVEEYLNKVVQPRPAVAAPQPQPTAPVRERDPVDAYLDRIQAIKERDRIGLIREVISGATLQFGEELEAFFSDEPYDVALKRIREEMADYELRSPRAAFYGEVAGALPTSVGVISGLRALGVTSGAVAGGLETGAYGIGSGEDAIDRLEKGAYYGAGGAIVGRIFDSIFDPQLGRQVGSVEELNAQKANLQEQLLQEARIDRPTAQITNDELATQLLMREIEYLGDVVGRQGADPSDLGSMLTRMRTYAENMGVNMKQFNKVYGSNKEIKELRDLINQPFDTLEDLTFLRQDLIDMTTKRLIADTNNTIPQAQSTIVKLRRLASPLATLAEETVGRSFSERIIIGMNRVVRGQTVLDRMWKGMEPFRELAETNVKFNDALLDTMNARLSQEFREKRLRVAINIAKNKIGKDAEGRLNQFFDDNLEFSKRYRREVTAGDLSRVWMHSNLSTTAKDSSLRSFRKKAEAKAEDAASKDIKRPSMKEWRKKNKDPNKDYENIFDSHWRWQRQTLTRMELGKQLGFRTAGKPLVAQGKKTLEETAAKEAGSFKLFDDRIIEEALKREGLSEVQINNAKQIIDDLGINANKGMSHELELVRSLGYVGTIANPYGALMNIHDLFNASFELGVKNVVGALFDRGGITFNPADMGLARQVFGEFVRKARKGTDQKLLGEKISGNQFLENAAQASESLLEWSMKWSGFSKLDQFGKSRIMGASFRKARQDIANGSFDNKWQYSFSKPEIDQLKRDIAAGNTSSELVRDLVMFDLFRLQPINAAAQTAFGLANPNARLFYMLKGFAIKQFDLMERRIFKEWQNGNKRQALENAMRYLILSGGGYGIVNEGRQVIKGDVPDPEQAAIGALYQVGSVLTFGAMGANDYGYDKFMSDPVNAIVSNMFPPVTATLPAAVIEDTADVARALLAGEMPNPIPDDSLEALPIIGKTIKGITEE